jgi:hypothetical protein
MYLMEFKNDVLKGLKIRNVCFTCEFESFVIYYHKLKHHYKHSTQKKYNQIECAKIFIF